MISPDLDNMALLYDKASPHDIDHALTFGWYPGRIIRHSPSGDLLELGIGHGEVSRRFAQVYDRHVIIEGSQAVIRSFGEKFDLPHVEIVNCLFEDYGSSDTFDVIVMGFILEHVDDPLSILGKFRKHIRPHGRLYVTVPNAASLHRRLAVEAGMLEDIYQLSDYDRAVGHKRYFDCTSITKLVQSAGYSVEAREGVFLKPFTSAQIISLNLPPSVLRAMNVVGVSYPELANSVLLLAGSKSDRR